MSKPLSIAAVASAIMIAAALVSPATAAQINVNNGHFNSVGRSAEIGVRGDFARSEANFVTPNMANTSHTPRQRKWVCGPIVNYDGTPHCHWGL
jgi:hypothetical protein